MKKDIFAFDFGFRVFEILMIRKFGCYCPNRPSRPQAAQSPGGRFVDKILIQFSFKHDEVPANMLVHISFVHDKLC